MIQRFIIRATSNGKPHTVTWDHFSKEKAVQDFLQNRSLVLYPDTVIHTVDELGPIHLLESN